MDELMTIALLEREIRESPFGCDRFSPLQNSRLRIDARDSQIRTAFGQQQRQAAVSAANVQYAPAGGKIEQRQHNPVEVIRVIKGFHAQAQNPGAALIIPAAHRGVLYV